MAFFQLWHDKPGLGVSKEEVPGPAPIQFFKIYTRKFWYLVKLNLLYAAFCILFYVPVILALYAHTFGSPIFYLATLPVLFTGPFTAGFVYELRDFTRERHSFIWADFKDTARINRKQALQASTICVVGFDIICLLFQFYKSLIFKNPMFYLILGVVCVCGLLFLFMQYYVFLQLVSFNLHLNQIYRNALILSIAGFGRNILASMISAGILIVSILFTPLLIFTPFITLSTIGLLIIFIIWPLVKKHMIDPPGKNEMAAKNSPSI